MDTNQKELIKETVRETYGKIAVSEAGIGCGCDSGSAGSSLEESSLKLGYSATDLEGIPEGANMGLGCGNPHSISTIKEGETVLDLGSGGGFDAFIAARAVGENGSVIGVDMTAAMVSKARLNAGTLKLTNVDFRLGEIEHLPVADEAVDLIISNCVINLSTDKPAVFSEAYRVLKPGGRLAISDVVAHTTIPEKFKDDLASYSGCLSGAEEIEKVKEVLESTGFVDVSVVPRGNSKEIIDDWEAGRSLADYVTSADISAKKPN